MELINESIFDAFDASVKKQLLSLSIDLINKKLIKINQALCTHDNIILFHSLHTLKGLSYIGIEKIPLLCQNMIDIIDTGSDNDLICKFEILKEYSIDYINFIKTQILY
jgi:hypothetical protein